MGTDINGVAEWRWRTADPGNPNSWHLIAPVPDMRSYRVFELLADVRASGDLDKTFVDSIPLRGLPKSYQDAEMAHGFNLGDFSHTWYGLEELRKRDMWDQIECETPRELWWAFLEYVKWFRLSWWECEARIVIGFDN